MCILLCLQCWWQLASLVSSPLPMEMLKTKHKYQCRVCAMTWLPVPLFGVGGTQNTCKSNTEQNLKNLCSQIYFFQFMNATSKTPILTHVGGSCMRLGFRRVELHLLFKNLTFSVGIE